MSRQRDLAHVWADKTRGYLGELSFKQFLKNKWGIDSQLGHERGTIPDYLSMDIRMVKTSSDSDFREPRKKIGIKTNKLNGIWCDIWGNEFDHSDIHVLMKVGAGRAHLLSYLKDTGALWDSVLMSGRNIGHITEEKATEIMGHIPDMAPIPAYMCGFVRKDREFPATRYAGRKKIKHFEIESWNGPIVVSEDLPAIAARESLPPGGEASFKCIQRFSHDRGHLFNTGCLSWRREEWDRALTGL